jgi:hypothetical protein
MEGPNKNAGPARRPAPMSYIYKENTETLQYIEPCYSLFLHFLLLDDPLTIYYLFTLMAMAYNVFR